MSETFTVEGPVHGERTWRLLGERDHERPGRKPVRLFVWATECVFCGEEFTIAMRRRFVTKGARRSLFSIGSCSAHRLSRRDCGRLHGGNAIAAFEEIRAEKLGLTPLPHSATLR